jgi:Copper amine oxidase N-terminal domain
MTRSLKLVSGVSLGLLLSLSVCLAADNPVKVVVNGKPVTIKPPAIEHGGSAYLPLRAGTEALGAHVSWNPNTQTATVTMCGQIARIKASDGLMIKNDLYLPLRLMGKQLKCTIKYDATKNTVFITKPKTGG